MRPSKRGETWVYPKSADVLRAARERTIVEYIAAHRQNIIRTIAEYIAARRQNILRTIADRPILEECRGAERRRGSPPRLYWWEQEVEEELSSEEEEEEEDWLAG